MVLIFLFYKNKGSYMNIIIKSNGLDALYVVASGRLDLDSAVEYGIKIKDTIEDSNINITELILDFSQITFISSFGLKIILELYKFMKERNGTLKLKSVSESLMNSFRMVGFNKFLVFE